MHIDLFPSSNSSAQRAAFTLMEILVVIAIILILAAIAFPVIGAVQQRAHKAVALNNMRQLTAALLTYTTANDGTLPPEDAKGIDTWQNAANPANAKVWYNALPKILNMQTVGDYASKPREFYTKSNILFLTGATYPETDKKLVQPLFAIAINTKLERKNEDKKKEPLKLPQVTHPTRTVIFLEQGLPSEKKSSPTQPKYDGSCKGSAKSFVARYGGKGVLTFLDGHSEEVEVRDLLTETGKFIFPQTNVVWTRDPMENPNKDDTGGKGAAP